MRRESHLVPLPRGAGTSGRALRPFQGSRNHRVTSPIDGASPTTSPAAAQRQRSDPARCDRRRAPPPTTRRLAHHPRHLAALAPAPNRPPLDPTPPITRAAIHHCRDRPTHHRHGNRQPHLGLPPHSWRARSARPPRRGIHGVDDPQTARHRFRTTTLRGSSSPPTARTSGCTSATTC